MVRQHELALSYKAQGPVNQTLEAAKAGQERGRYLALDGKIRDLEDIRARLLDYERRPFLQVVDDIRIAKMAARYLLRECYRRAVSRSTRWRAVEKKLRSLRVSWLLAQKRDHDFHLGPAARDIGRDLCAFKPQACRLLYRRD